MPDYSFIAQPQVQNPANTLGSMMDIAGKAQALQTSRQSFESQNIDLQKAQQANDERLRLQQFMANPDNFQTNGRIDLDKANAAIPKIAPYTGGEVLQKLSVLSNAQTTALSAKQNLTQSQRAIVANPIGILGRAKITDPAIYDSELQNLKTTNPDNPELHKLIDSYSKVLGMTPAGPHVADVAVRASQSLLGPGEQQIAFAPKVGLESTGGKLEQTTTQPPVGGAPGSVTVGQNAPGAGAPLTIAPGSLETVEVGPDGNKYIVQRSAQGTIVGTRSLGGAGQGTGQPGSGGQPAGGGMPFISPEDQLTRPVLEAERNQARTILSSAPIAHTTNRGILEELDNVISTGATGGFMARAASIAGSLGLKAPENAASAYDLIGKYTERNALEAAKAMGPGTNAGLEAAIKANGSAAYNPTALKVITRLNDAIMSGAELYQPGLEKAIAANPQRGVLVKREFDQAWAQNFDTRIMELESGSLSAKSLTPAVKKELLRKAQNLQALSARGSL
jgi:hypothetical protein